MAFILSSLRGFEPPAFRLGGERSILLSYGNKPLRTSMRATDNLPRNALFVKSKCPFRQIQCAISSSEMDRALKPDLSPESHAGSRHALKLALVDADVHIKVTHLKLHLVNMFAGVQVFHPLT